MNLPTRYTIFQATLLNLAVMPATCPAQTPSLAPQPCMRGQSFQAFCANLGLLNVASWSFSPHDIPSAGSTLLNDPLSRTTHATNANDPWTSNTNQNTWPEAVNNLEFTSNTTPNGQLTPRGPNGLRFNNNGAFPTLGAAVAADSISIVCGSPSTARSQGMLIEVAGEGHTRIRVTYESGNGLVLTTDYFVTLTAGQKVPVSFIHSKIHRVDVWNTAGGSEYIASVAIYRRRFPIDLAGNNCVIDIDDLVTVITNWGQGAGNIADVTHNGIVNIDDLVTIITAWGPLSSTPQCFGESPAAGSCNDDSQCFPGFCDFTTCTPALCLCDEGQWICTNDCCGHCSGITD